MKTINRHWFGAVRVHARTTLVWGTLLYLSSLLPANAASREERCMAMPSLMADDEDTLPANPSEEGGEEGEEVHSHLTLHEVTVMGVTGETKVKHSSIPVSVIVGDALRRGASTNVIDGIAKQPGLAQITTGSGISKPVIRGLGYNRIVVVNDGVRQEGQQWGDEHGIEIDPHTVDKVEIIKGPASLMYGSDAMAGVIVMRDRDLPFDGDVRADLRSEYQTNNGLFAYSLSADGNRKGFVWEARFSDKMAHAYRNAYDGYVPGSQFKELAARLMVGLDKRWGHSYLIGTYYDLTPGIIEGERDEQTGVLEAPYDRAKTYAVPLPFQKVRHQKMVWDNSLRMSTVGWLDAIVGYQQNQRQEFEDSRTLYELYFKLHTLTYDVKFRTAERNGWKTAAGVSGMYQSSRNLGEESLIPEYDLFDFGCYATASKTIARWTLSGGLRYDHRHLDYHDRDFSGATGSLGGVWNMTEAWSLRLNMARGFRSPNMSELGSDGVHEGSVRYEIGNADLKAEYSWQIDAGFDFRSGCLSAQLALFANRIDNYIFPRRVDYEVREGYATYLYAQGQARIAGFEATVDFHPIRHLHFDNSFSYVHAVQRNQPRATKYLPFTPAPRWISDLRYEFGLHDRIVSQPYIGVGMEYSLRQSHYYQADATETATPSYALFGLTLGMDLQLRGRKVAEVRVDADNIFDRTYQNHLSRLKYTSVNPLTGRQGVYNMGRNVMFLVRIPIEFQRRTD